MTPALIRAARGLLNWQQQDLATAAGLSLSAVNNFERGLGKTRTATVQRLMTTLEETGIEFLPNGGLRHAEDVNGIQRHSGSDFIHKMNEDVYVAIRKPGEEILTFSADESHWFARDIKPAVAKYFEWRTRMAVKESYLVAEGNTVFEAPRTQYRFLPAALIGKITYTIYADRIAFINWRKKQVFILRGQQLVDPFREQFKFLWRQGKEAK